MGISTDGLPITPYLHSWAYQQVAHLKTYKYWARYKNWITSFRANSDQEARQLAAGYFRIRTPNLILLQRTKE